VEIIGAINHDEDMEAVGREGGGCAGGGGEDKEAAGEALENPKAEIRSSFVKSTTEDWRPKDLNTR
jgi:hypothetical protein